MGYFFVQSKQLTSYNVKANEDEKGCDAYTAERVLFAVLCVSASMCKKHLTRAIINGKHKRTCT